MIFFNLDSCERNIALVEQEYRSCRSGLLLTYKSSRKLLSNFCRRRLPLFSVQFCSWQPEKRIFLTGSRVYQYIWLWGQPKNSFMGKSLWRNPMLRLISELVPHYSQCVLILCMSVERYILICHAASAARLLSKKRRILCYTLIVLLLLAVTGSVFTLMYPGFTPHFYEDYVNETPQFVEMKFLKVDNIGTLVEPPCQIFKNLKESLRFLPNLKDSLRFLKI